MLIVVEEGVQGELGAGDHVSRVALGSGSGMGGRYRALLIGNSTYLADEHNLQPLKGPVKDIAVLNRALVDRDSGLFDDVDVTLLPEATSARAIRALGRFFGTAQRDNVLFVYFSGHGKLDQNGRLHLCMQDTETSDLLATALSSTRINEFADASSARNVVIVLDCCHAGAFRGGELGDAVAGPGRYVLTSCRGTQLANDATVENGTSFFTQHLVDGLLGAAPDNDGDGYVGFSDLYAYVDRQLREEGKQVPQRRVNGDGDLLLARRARSAVPEAIRGQDQAPPAEVSQPDLKEVSPTRTAGREAGVAVTAAPAKTVSPGDAGVRRRHPLQRRGLIALAAGVVVVAGGAAAAIALLSGGSGKGGNNTTPGEGSYTAAAPWRIRVNGSNGPSDGCMIALTETHSGTPVLEPGNGIYGIVKLQIYQTGSFRWRTNDAKCLVTPLAGSGTATLPVILESSGDSDAFRAPARVSVQVKDFNGNSSCRSRLLDVTNGQELDVAPATPQAPTVTLDPNGRTSVYVENDSCVVRVSAAS
jgi:Caspase domain